MSTKVEQPPNPPTTDAVDRTSTPSSTHHINMHKMKGATVLSPTTVSRLGSDNGTFWVNLLKQQMGDQIFQQQSHLATLYLGNGSSSHLNSMEELSEEFDQTQFGTETLFELFDEDNTGFLSHSEFHSGLKSQNLLILDSNGNMFKELLNMVDTNNDGEISLEEFQISLERLRLARLHLLGRNMRLIGKSSSLHCVDYQSQRAVFQNPVHHQLSFFFSPKHQQPQQEPSKNNHTNDAPLDTRWIHLSGHDNITVLRLAVKHGLHPMAVLDALNLHQKAPVCAQYGKANSHRHEDLFVVCPQLRLTTSSMHDYNAFQSKESDEFHRRVSRTNHASHQQREHPKFDIHQDYAPVRAEIEHNSTGIFFLPASHILISLELDWSLQNSQHCSSQTSQKRSGKESLASFLSLLNPCSCCHRRRGTSRGTNQARGISLSRSSGSFVGAVSRKSSNKVHVRSAPPPPNDTNGVPPILMQSTESSSTPGLNQLSKSPTITSYGKKKMEIEHGEQSIISKVCHHLSRKYTLLRRSGIERLLHTILDTVVKNYLPIARAYRIELDFYQAVLQEEQAKFKKIHVENLLRIKRELKQLSHQLRPVKTVMSSLVKSGNFDEDLSFFQDIEDTLTQILYEIETCTELAIELNESFIHYHDRRMNDVLYVLTIVTTCVIPTQLFTGVFGMNFSTSTNELGFQDPFLVAEWGYWFFWIFSFCTTLLGVFVFRFCI